MIRPAPIAIMDIEWTSWPGAKQRRWQGPGEEMEIVQIGAIRLMDDDGLKEIDALDILVKPRINPRLSNYFVELTGITQAQLDWNGIGFAAALERLKAFFQGVRAVCSYGTDYTIISHNCGLHGLPFPFEESLFRNVREDIAGAVGFDPLKVYSSELPGVMGFPPPGTAHQGVDVCRCIAEAMRILRRQGKL
jgi:inhibitor of KinA sporulation pathway (predicted exonuclease)